MAYKKTHFDNLLSILLIIISVILASSGEAFAGRSSVVNPKESDNNKAFSGHSIYIPGFVRLPRITNRHGPHPHPKTGQDWRIKF